MTSHTRRRYTHNTTRKVLVTNRRDDNELAKAKLNGLQGVFARIVVNQEGAEYCKISSEL